MEILNNISPLPFYTSLQQQHHRKDYAFGQIYPLFIWGNNLIPFQIILSHSAGYFGTDFNNDFSYGLSAVPLSITSINLISLKNGTSINILSAMLTNGLTLVATGAPDITILKYPGLLPIPDINELGQYYIEITLGATDVIYSEIFTRTDDIASCIRLEYSNSYNFELPKGHVDFSNSFRFICFIDTKIGKPEYVFEEEATNRMGYSFIESQVSKKVFRFVALAPEYLCDALRLVRLCNTKKIYDGLTIYDLNSFGIDPKWQEQGDLASIECEFETDIVITNIGNI